MIYAVIPVKHKSERVNNKNFRPFIDNKSILDIKIEQLLKLKFLKKIFISSNKKSLSIYNSPKIQLISRANKFCNNKISWSEMISHVIESLPIKMNDLVLWCHTTSPLFDNFEKAINEFMLKEKKGYDSLVTTTRYNGFLLDQNLNPLNYQWGKWHKYSQFLKSKFYSINGALFIARKKTFLKYDYVIGNNPTNFICTEKESIDIDNDIDFKYAQFLLKNAKKKLS